MKRILSLTGTLALILILLSAFSIRENPQDPPRGKKTEKHIKLVKIDDNGKKTELDTVIESDKVFVWNGDTIGGKKDLKWLSKDDFKLDSIHENFDMNFEYKIEDDGEGKIMILKSGKEGKKGERDIMMWHGSNGENVFFNAPEMPGVPRPPHTPDVMFFRNKKRTNVIDLSDPGIISFDKKVRKDGTEKITIVRKQVAEEDNFFNEEIIFPNPVSAPMIIHEKHPGEAKRIKIIKSEDGKTQVIEDDGTWSVKEGDENVKVIKEDGKIIRIKETKDGDEKKVEVEVEVEEEKK